MTVSHSNQRIEGLLSGASAIAITDLFLSATAALLIVLALARPDVPQPIPVQAELIAFCPETNSNRSANIHIGRVEDIRKSEENLSHSGSLARISKPEELGAGLRDLEVPAALFLNIALVSGPKRPISLDCIRFLERSIIGAHNQGLNTAPPDAPLKTIFATTITSHHLTSESL